MSVCDVRPTLYSVASAQATLSRLQAEFATALEDQLWMPYLQVGSPEVPTVCWQGICDQLGQARLTSFLAPHAGRPERLFLVRIELNRPPLVSESWLRGEFQYSDYPVPVEARGEVQPWTFRLTLLPEQVLAFVPWVASVICAHEAGEDCVLEVPPENVLCWPRWGLTCDYAWSASARCAVEPLLDIAREREYEQQLDKWIP